MSPKHRTNQTALTILLALGLTTLLHARATYYIDAVNGDDARSGTSAATAWKSLNKVNTCFPACATFVPGDSILLKAGSVFTGGQIWPNTASQGTPTSPIVVDTYGVGPKPLIACNLGSTEPGGSTGQANGKDNGAAILLKQVAGWEINNLELTNPNGMGGIKVFHSGVATHYRFRNLTIHNINGTGDGTVFPSSASPFAGGILFKIGDSNNTNYDDVIIDGCTIYDIFWIGIQTGNWSMAADPAHRFSRFVVRNTIVHDTRQLGIILRNCNGALIEGCTVYNTGLARNKESFGIRLKFNTGSKIQSCEAYQNASWDNSGEGGQGFTFDGTAVACTLQYCYSHNNLGGFVSVISDPGEISSDNVIRYNVSQNDSNQTFWFGVSGTAPTNTSIYNNTIYVDASVPLTKVVAYESGTGTSFRNNILYINRAATYDAGPTWDHNCFYGTNPNTPTDANKVTADPLFLQSGGSSAGMASAGGFRLKPSSPCLNAGVSVPNNGGRDFWGNPVPFGGTSEIGAYEGAGENGVSVGPTARLSHTSQAEIARVTTLRNGVLEVRALNDRPFSATLLALNGAVLQRVSGTADRSVALDLSGLAAQSYLLVVSSGGRTITRIVRTVQ